MNVGRVRAELARMATQPGLEGCALVEADTGLVWHACGFRADEERVWEATVDYWRLYQRQKTQFAGLGPLGAAAMYHTAGMLVVLPCCTEPDVLLVLHGRHRTVDWIALQGMARALGRLLKSPC